MKCIKLLKNHKACADDEIINEHINSSYHYTFIFFSIDILPESTWLEGIIKPIYKKKGDPLQPENHCPVTILRCLGKLFTTLLNLRLNILNEHEVDLLFNVLRIVCGSSVFVIILLCITLCPF